MDIVVKDGLTNAEIEKQGGSLSINPELAIYKAVIWFLQIIHDGVTWILETLDEYTTDTTIWIRLFSGMSFKLAVKDPVDGWEVSNFVPNLDDFTGKTYSWSLGNIRIRWLNINWEIKDLWSLIKLIFKNQIISNADVYWYDRTTGTYSLGSTLSPVRKYTAGDLAIDVSGVAVVSLCIAGLSWVGFQTLSDFIGKKVFTSINLVKSAYKTHVKDALSNNYTKLLANGVQMANTLIKLGSDNDPTTIEDQLDDIETDTKDIQNSLGVRLSPVFK